MVTGGAGYIGSVVTEELLSDGHSVVVLDDLSKGHAAAVPPAASLVNVDIADSAGVRAVLTHYRIEAVVHMAAYSLVSESVVTPHDYYRNNVVGTLSLLEAMRDCGVKALVFSSTAAVYGAPEKQPIEESDPTAPTNPYGETKLAIEKALHWFDAAYGIRYASLRYFNAAGATERCGEWHSPESHLIPILLQTAMGERECVQLYGDDYPTSDGTCIRDYIHVVDIARAHIQALPVLKDRSVIYNLGCGGDGYSVRQVIDCASRVVGAAICIRSCARRPGDPAVLIASSLKIQKELNWKPRYPTLEDIIGSAWKWLKAHGQGYAPSPARLA
jgi:UDP-glucose 4-epimerase